MINPDSIKFQLSFNDKNDYIKSEEGFTIDIYISDSEDEDEELERIRRKRIQEMRARQEYRELDHGKFLEIGSIDEFHGTNKGLLLAEVELSDINQNVVLPDFIVEEVTGINKYYNSMLQKTPYTLWDNKSSK